MIKQLKPSWRGEYEITDTIRLMIQNGYRVGYGIHEGWWFDTGKKDDILFVNSVILDERIKPDVRGEIVDSKINGRVTVCEGTRIVKSTIRGPCIIGKNCKIENAYIGPYTSIGDNTEITDSSVEYSILMDNVLIKGIRRLEESIIGSNAKLIKEAEVDSIRLHVGDYSEIIL
jgi:glucose-1-phosphate thymidylyltransferase